MKNVVTKLEDSFKNLPDGRVVCWFSHGIASTIAAKLAIDVMLNTADREIHIVDIYLKDEHLDNIRFYEESKTWLLKNVPSDKLHLVKFETLVNEKHGGSVDDVIARTGYMSGVYGAQCTKVLKKEVRYDWQLPSDVHVFGMTVEESKRIDNIIDSENDITMWTPLILGEISKMDCFDLFSDSGVEVPMMYKLGYNNNNCFHGDEQFITDDGFKTFKDVVGESFNVVTRDGWKKGIVKHFGKQELMKITLSRGANTKDVLVTPNHRWILPKHNHYSFGYKEVNTQELKIGDFIPSTYIKNDLDFDVEGVRHGFVFGDGTLYNKSSGNILSKVAFCGDKVELFKYFDGVLSPSNYLHGLPSYYKELPDKGSSKEYLLGFIIGLVASDGGVSKSGIIISQVDEDVILQLEEVVSSLGMLPSLNSANRDTNFKINSTLYSITIPKSCFKVGWLLRSFHKDRFGDRRTNPKSWKVVGLERTGFVDDVYCLQVEGEYKEFTLRGGILTGNCIGCVKAGGSGYWNHTRKLFPDVFKTRLNQEYRLGVALVKMTLNVFLNKHRSDAITFVQGKLNGDFPEFKIDGRASATLVNNKPTACILIPTIFLPNLADFDVIPANTIRNIEYDSVAFNAFNAFNEHTEMILEFLQWADNNDREIKAYTCGIRVPLRYLPVDAGDQKSMYVGDCGFFCEAEDD